MACKCVYTYEWPSFFLFFCVLRISNTACVCDSACVYVCVGVMLTSTECWRLCDRSNRPTIKFTSQSYCYNSGPSGPPASQGLVEEQKEVTVTLEDGSEGYLMKTVSEKVPRPSPDAPATLNPPSTTLFIAPYHYHSLITLPSREQSGYVYVERRRWKKQYKYAEEQDNQQPRLKLHRDEDRNSRNSSFNSVKFQNFILMKIHVNPTTFTPAGWSVPESCAREIMSVQALRLTWTPLEQHCGNLPWRSSC